jgi:hypothetical protein
MEGASNSPGLPPKADIQPALFMRTRPERRAIAWRGPERLRPFARCPPLVATAHRLAIAILLRGFVCDLTSRCVGRQVPRFEVAITTEFGVAFKKYFVLSVDIPQRRADRKAFDTRSPKMLPMDYLL